MLTTARNPTYPQPCAWSEGKAQGPCSLMALVLVWHTVCTRGPHRLGDICISECWQIASHISSKPTMILVVTSNSCFSLTFFRQLLCKNIFTSPVHGCFTLPLYFHAHCSHCCLEAYRIDARSSSQSSISFLVIHPSRI